MKVQVELRISQDARMLADAANRLQGNDSIGKVANRIPYMLAEAILRDNREYLINKIDSILLRGETEDEVTIKTVYHPHSKLNMVKEYKEQTGKSLMESKQAVERLIEIGNNGGIVATF